MLTVLCGAQNNGIPWTTIPKSEYMGFTYDDAQLARMERMDRAQRLARQAKTFDEV